MNRTAYVIIGNGMAGNRAAETLRERDPDGVITVVSAGTLLHYQRNRLSELFDGRTDWRDYLVHQPDFYDRHDIRVRRQSRVVKVDSEKAIIHFDNNETLKFDKLLVATGSTRHLPDDIADFADHLHYFDSYEEAARTRRALPDGGRLLVLGGDMAVIGLALRLANKGYRVSLVPHERTFRPHMVPVEAQPKYLKALADTGIAILDRILVEEVKPANGAKQVRFADGHDIVVDVVLASYGPVPAVDFMHGAGVEIERGILVNQHLRSAKDTIWAAGEACQMENAGKNPHVYSYELIAQMGEVAARNMTGNPVDLFEPDASQDLELDENGQLKSIFLSRQGSD